MSTLITGQSKVQTIREESPVTILAALVAIVAIGGALLVVALFGQEQGADSTPIVLYVTGTVTTVVVALLALFKAEQGSKAAQGAKEAAEATLAPSEAPPAVDLPDVGATEPR